MERVGKHRADRTDSDAVDGQDGRRGGRRKQVSADLKGGPVGINAKVIDRARLENSVAQGIRDMVLKVLFFDLTLHVGANEEPKV